MAAGPHVARCDMRHETKALSAAPKKSVWPNEADLKRLVQSAQRGDPGAIDALLARLRPSLMAFLAGGMARDEAEDWAQLALICIARALDRIDPARALPYTVTVAKNLRRAARYRSTLEARRRAPVDLAEALESPGRCDEEVEYADLVAAVRRLSRSTLPRDQGDLVLDLLAGLNLSDLAARYGLIPETVRTRLRRARARLRAELRFYSDLIHVRQEPKPKVTSEVREEPHRSWRSTAYSLGRAPSRVAPPEIDPAGHGSALSPQRRAGVRRRWLVVCGRCETPRPIGHYSDMRG